MKVKPKERKLHYGTMWQPSCVGLPCVINKYDNIQHYACFVMQSENGLDHDSDVGSSGEDLPVVDLTATSVEHKTTEKHCSREESSADK